MEATEIGGPADIAMMEFGSSPSIGKIGAALAAAQGEIANAKADSENPHFQSHYADLASIIDAVRLPLSKAGIARHQALMSRGSEVGVRTSLIHSSGEWVANTVWCRHEGTPQKLGSVVTYLRRYSLAAAVGLAQEDDDGNVAEESAKKTAKAERPKLPANVQARIKILQGEIGVADPEWREKLRQYYQVTSSTELNAEQAQDLIRRLENMRRPPANTGERE